MSLLATGCAHNNLLYDENRDKQAQAAQKAVTEAHVAGAVAALEKTFADVATREEEGAREQASYLFDLELKTVSRAAALDSTFSLDDDTGVDGLITVLKARLTKLGLHDVTAQRLTKLREANVTITAANQAMRETATEFKGIYQVEFADCAAVYVASADPANKSETPSERLLALTAPTTPETPAQTRERQQLVALKFSDLIAKCKESDGVLEPFFGKGEVRDLIANVANAEKRIGEQELIRADARKQLAAATAEFKKASKATEPGKSALESLEEHANDLNAKLKQITALGAAAGKEIASEKLKSLEALLTAIAGQTGDGPPALDDDQKTFVAIVRDLPALKDEAAKLFAESQKPRLVPLLAAIDHQKAVIAGYDAALGAKQKQADAARNHLRAALNESVALARVLQPITKDAAWASQSLKALDDSLNANDAKKRAARTALHRALAVYADDVPQARMEQAVWTVRERAALYEENLAVSKSAAAQWDVMMDTLAKVLADYHAAGIKRADIAEFFKALGLVTIGIGVAQ